MEKTNGEDVQSKREKKENRMSYSVETPYGFHLDLDFLKYVHDIEKGNTIKRIHIHRRAKQSKFSTLPRNFSVPDSSSHLYSSTASRTWSPSNYKTDTKDNNAFSAGDSSLRLRYVHELNYRRKDHVFDTQKPTGEVYPEDFSDCRSRPQFTRASSMPASLPQSTMSLEQTQYLKLPQPINKFSDNRIQNLEEPSGLPHVGSDTQITSALKRIQDLEEQLKSIPELKQTISVLKDNNNQITVQLRSLSQLLTNKNEHETLELSISESESNAEAAIIRNGEDNHHGQLPSSDFNLSIFSDIERQVTVLKEQLQDSTMELQNLQELVERQNNEIKEKDAHITELRDILIEMEKTIESTKKEEIQHRDLAVNTEQVQITDLKETCDKSVHASISADTRSVGCGEFTLDQCESELECVDRADSNNDDESSGLILETCITMDVPSSQNLFGNELNMGKATKSDGNVGQIAHVPLDIIVRQAQIGESTVHCSESIIETKHCPSEATASGDASIGQYVRRIQDLLQEQWTCLETGYPDLASAIKQPASKLSSIQNQLVNSLNVLSSVYSSQMSSDKEHSQTGSQQAAGASPRSSLKSIMKKKSSNCRSGQESLAKKNLQFVGVNGGYETTSSEDSSSSEEFCSVESEKAEGPTNLPDGSNNQLATSPISPENEKEESAELTGPAVCEVQHSVQRYAVGDTFRSDCQILSSRLAELQNTSDNQLRQTLYTVCQEWFRVSSQKSSSPDLVAVYLEEIRSISPQLLQMVVNIADENGNTSLHYSVSHSNFGIVKLLLETGVCDVDHQNKAGYTPVMLTPLASAETDEDMEVVLELLNSGNVNLCATQGGQTALMLGVSHGRSDMVKVLLHCGADVNLQDKDGESALMIACQLGNMEMVKLLVSHPECDIELTDKAGNSALSLVLNSTHTEIAEFLQAHTELRSSCPSTEMEKGASL
ncbi:KN motif and ankyrin repeat domain-containing protein 4 isoform X1 [Pelobates fuscus]|uniref:KN motif and ankyrin repeat domain-containing protein 4 isoform X1 n=1 Tax=Pelobates fuscus TaxID=191477 RepID=UPI002FE43875